ncbi:NmrA family NAD(P)-binding protein [Demequina sp. TTPB684]|uniref:NmrA family NAD(P)-binding protein n=1 Tax=unclassified Demequina TaxID=2620311 RepID=UPI001CF2432B|nr:MULTISPECIES: NmrA family NAD(P)-binding protein [unclassified Demequina]MCB2412087.1 NmrA family NAD(P)-binding protein [Demequina sp. TTPB684]UPU88624.1 NmrA family NAD(P)-binding protein [Demequina sp. TMPB413]
MTTYAVTGASGSFGRLAIEALIARGVAPIDIVAIARTTDKVSDLATQGVVVRHGDYDEEASLDTALAGVDRLLLVSSNEFGKRAEQHATVIAAAERAGVSHIAYTSILGAPTTSNPIAGEHVATEAALAQSSIPTTLLRNSWYFENYTVQIGQYSASGVILGATQNAPISAATRADYADAAAVALIAAEAGAVYELGGPTFTLTELAAAVSSATGAAVEHRDMTVPELASAFESFGMEAGMASTFAGVDGSIARGELFTDSGDLETLMGRKPESLAAAVAQATH